MMDFEKMLNQDKIHRRAFYPYEGAGLQLPQRHIKAYMLGSSFEYSRTTDKEKVEHLAYAVGNGFDIWNEIEETEMPTSMLNWTLASKISYLRYGDGRDAPKMTSWLVNALSVPKLYELFLEELKYYVSYKEEGDDIVFSHRESQWPAFDKIRHLESILLPSKYENFE